MKVSVVLAQPPLHDTDATINAERIIAGIRLAKGSHIVVFPETALSGKSFDVPTAHFIAISDAARDNRIWVIYGTYLKFGKDVVNSAVILRSDGSLAACVQKTHLWNEPSVKAGNGAPFVIDTCEFGKLGVVICWDIAHQDPLRALARSGADIIFCPAFWFGEQFGTTKVLPALVRAQAFMNQVFTVLVDARNPETTGWLLAASPTGAMLIEEVKKNGAIPLARITLDLSILRKSRETFDCGPQARE